MSSAFEKRVREATAYAMIGATREKTRRLVKGVALQAFDVVQENGGRLSLLQPYGDTDHIILDIYNPDPNVGIDDIKMITTSIRPAQEGDDIRFSVNTKGSAYVNGRSPDTVTDNPANVYRGYRHAVAQHAERTLGVLAATHAVAYSLDTAYGTSIQTQELTDFTRLWQSNHQLMVGGSVVLLVHDSLGEQAYPVNDFLPQPPEL